MFVTVTGKDEREESFVFVAAGLPRVDFSETSNAPAGVLVPKSELGRRRRRGKGAPRRPLARERSSRAATVRDAQANRSRPSVTFSPARHAPLAPSDNRARAGVPVPSGVALPDLDPGVPVA